MVGRDTGGECQKRGRGWNVRPWARGRSSARLSVWVRLGMTGGGLGGAHRGLEEGSNEIIMWCFLRIGELGVRGRWENGHGCAGRACGARGGLQASGVCIYGLSLSTVLSIWVLS